MHKEIWKTVPGYPSYKVSNTGKVKRLKSVQVNKDVGEFEVPETLLKPCVNAPYLYVNFDNKQHAIHRLVAEAFIKHTSDQVVVIHIDGNTTNNDVDNLKWISRQECSKYNYDMGNIVKPPSYTGKKVRCIETSETFDSIKAAAKDCKLSAESVSRSAYSSRPVKGYTFEFVV